MNLYLISQSVNHDYDTYDSAVVIAPDEEVAKTIHPSGDQTSWGWNYGGWCASPDQVSVKFLGVSDNPIQGLVLASFNAG